MINQIFVNLAVKDLQSSVDFFTKLGFTFNPKFTDEKATCMVIGENIFAMLLVESFFHTFTKKEIANTAESVEVLNALSTDSREKVDELVDKAIEAGGKEPRAAQEYPWMYGRAFEDLDGHTWEVFFMDMSKMPENPGMEASA